MNKIIKDWNDKKVVSMINDTLNKYDDGELFVENRISENFSYNNNKVKSASYNIDQGFGLRTVSLDSSGFAHSSELTYEALLKSIEAVKSIKKSGKKVSLIMPTRTNRALYTNKNPIELKSFKSKINLLEKINKYARNLSNKVHEVSISLAGNYQNIEILKKDSQLYNDFRPLVRLNINITVKNRNKIENGSYGFGGRDIYELVYDEKSWIKAADEAYKQALLRLDAANSPAGEQTVVLGPGWPGILLHEAIGHGLEGDFNRKKTSAFYNLVNEKVASDQITIVDNGTIKKRRGSLNIDDEGTPSQNTTLIEKGILKNFMHDRLNARLMNQKPTGNGRRQDYSNIPMPRMTNTYMLNGKYDPEELIRSTKKGVYATQFSGGQVDITSGKFVFSASVAYEINNGKIGKPIKGATLIGNGPDILRKVSMVGNDMQIDNGIGTCGKEGQMVPVGVGQPSLKIDNLTVGGTV